MKILVHTDVTRYLDFKVRTTVWRVTGGLSAFPPPHVCPMVLTSLIMMLQLIDGSYVYMAGKGIHKVPATEVRVV